MGWIDYENVYYERKYGDFRKVRFLMRPISYGHYLITATYRGRKIEVETTNIMAWVYLDDSYERKNNLNARRHCYMMIKQKYNSLLTGAPGTENKSQRHGQYLNGNGFQY